MILQTFIDQVQKTADKLEEVEVEINLDELYESLKAALFICAGLFAWLALDQITG